MDCQEAQEEPWRPGRPGRCKRAGVRIRTAYSCAITAASPYVTYTFSKTLDSHIFVAEGPWLVICVYMYYLVQRSYAPGWFLQFLSRLGSSTSLLQPSYGFWDVLVRCVLGFLAAWVPVRLEALDARCSWPPGCLHDSFTHGRNKNIHIASSWAMIGAGSYNAAGIQSTSYVTASTNLGYQHTSMEGRYSWVVGCLAYWPVG